MEHFKIISYNTGSTEYIQYSRMVLSRLGNFDQLVIYTRYALLYINLEKNDFGHSEQRISMLFARLMFSLNTKKKNSSSKSSFFLPDQRRNVTVFNGNKARETYFNDQFKCGVSKSCVLGILGVMPKLSSGRASRFVLEREKRLEGKSG